ncbi:uncharacterized protein LOC134852908 isoform X3 [Symsagittifera roscoffensis]|uniref:uncharacterized protein LOC134852908 isoform X3 n=1 Tax=Symsagittifera roscoffensis TaxID=84072 RepID=UPI00307B4701
MNMYVKEKNERKFKTAQLFFRLWSVIHATGVFLIEGSINSERLIYIEGLPADHKDAMKVSNKFMYPDEYNQYCANTEECQSFSWNSQNSDFRFYTWPLDPNNFSKVPRTYWYVKNFREVRNRFGADSMKMNTVNNYLEQEPRSLETTSGTTSVTSSYTTSVTTQGITSQTTTTDEYSWGTEWFSSDPSLITTRNNATDLIKFRPKECYSSLTGTKVDVSYCEIDSTQDFNMIVKHFKKIGTLLDWYGARAHCNSIGGRLYDDINFATNGEAEELYLHLQKHWFDLWFGLWSPANSGTWQTTAGVPVREEDIENWYGDEPNSHTSADRATRIYTMTALKDIPPTTLIVRSVCTMVD